MSNGQERIESGLNALLENQPPREVGRRMMALLDGVQKRHQETTRDLAHAVLSGEPESVRRSWENYKLLEEHFIPAFQNNEIIRRTLGEGLLEKLNSILKSDK